MQQGPLAETKASFTRVVSDIPQARIWLEIVSNSQHDVHMERSAEFRMSCGRKQAEKERSEHLH